MSAAIAATAAVVAMALGGGATDARLSESQLVGQRLVVGFEGSEVPATVRRRIADGELAGVVLFNYNFEGRAEAETLVSELRSIPRPAGLSEPLLVMVDQEGGLVKRLPGPPDLSAAAMGAAGTETCRDQGQATGASLRRTGFDVDLAPVLDVDQPGSAMGSEQRTFSADPEIVGACAEAFAQSLERAGVAPTAKHFPGLGAAEVNTDVDLQRIGLSANHLRRVDEAPYRRYIGDGAADRLVMLSSAVYPAFGDRPASLTHALATGELRDRLGFRGVSITDALETTAAFGEPAHTGVLATRAGADLLLFTSFEDADAAETTLGGLLEQPRARQDVATSVARVLALRARLAG
jgi:beta-N-acetylhexosaminidase